MGQSCVTLLALASFCGCPGKDKLIREKERRIERGMTKEERCKEEVT